MSKMIIRLILLTFCVTWSAEKNKQNKDCSAYTHSYVVSIFYNGGVSTQLICAGTLLSRYWALSSGTCLTECSTPQLYQVIAGRHPKHPKMLRYGENTEFSMVNYCYLYPDAERTVDIGLMELKTPIDINELISYVNLATYLDVVDRDIGRICKDAVAIGLDERDPVICVPTTVIAKRNCVSKWNRIVLRDQQCCARALKNTNPCPMVMGGPLMCRGVQYGIMTYAYSCNNKEKPVVVTLLDRYEAFIRGVIIDRNIYLNNQKSECSTTNNLVTLWIFTFILIFEFVK